MDLHAYRSLWDWDGVWQGRLESVAESGYHGIEWGLPDDPADDALFARALEQAGLAYIATIMTSGDHVRSFREQLSRAVQMGAVLISAHSAADDMDDAAHLHFFEDALKVEAAAGIPVAHETHRGRALYTPWHTAKILRALPDLRIGADFSHWSVVCGRPLDHSDPDIALAIDRAIHIHGRVGYAHGPQVPDPRAPEYGAEVGSFLTMWTEIARRRRDAGADALSFTPVFGPLPYMQARPFTREPAADVVEANEYILDQFKARFAENLTRIA